jgi:putative MATE family efflux protein
MNNFYYHYHRRLRFLKKLRKDLAESIAGTDRDFTTMKISRAIFLLAIPMVLEMVMESVFAVVDIFFVSRLGADAVAMVGITESLITVVYAIGIGLGAGTMALVARRIGEKRKDQAARVGYHAILLGLFVSLWIALAGIFYSEELLLLMGIDAGIAAEYAVYPTIMIGTNAVIMMLFIINAIFRSSGDAALSMRVLWIANIFNIILDPCLIFGLGPFPELGLKGAAIATSVGRGLAVLYQFYMLYYGKKRISLRGIRWKLEFGIFRKLVRLSAGGIGQMLIAESSWIILVRILAEFGSTVIAGYTIALRIILFILLPAFGLSNAAGTLVGQNLGARQPDRAQSSVWITGVANMVFLGIVALLFVLNPGYFIRLFIADPEVVAAGKICLRTISYGFIFYALGMVVVQAFNGSGDTFTPMKINVICFWIIEIPLAYLLAVTFGLAERGVYLSILISETAMTIISLWIFQRGRWKLNQV